MTVTENDRYHLHQRLEEVLDERGANTMMELLPPVGWADVATKRDLDQLEERIDLRFQNVGLRFDKVEETMSLRFDKVDKTMSLRFDKAAESVDIRFDQAVESTDLRFAKVEERIDSQAARTISKLLTVLVPIIAVAVAFLTAVSVWGPG